MSSLGLSRTQTSVTVMRNGTGGRGGQTLAEGNIRQIPVLHTHASLKVKTVLLLSD